MQAAMAADEDAMLLDDKIGRTEKQKKSDQREEEKRRKDKAVQREQKARAQAKGMME